MRITGSFSGGFRLADLVDNRGAARAGSAFAFGGDGAVSRAGPLAPMSPEAPVSPPDPDEPAPIGEPPPPIPVPADPGPPPMQLRDARD